jgi:hypothetical protein
MDKQLPKARLGAKEYYCDERLGEIRNVDNPDDRITKGKIIAAVNEVFDPTVDEMADETDSIEEMVNALNRKGVTAKEIR